ncbi:30S ribosomal protein S2 [Patescibacteria group bacterium]|nr:30S ribosomal protein S2 [Patescibacteria group bacterium]MCL5798433.1 30S ribosomal protein S2 [Patescibacteria group bacterium]
MKDISLKDLLEAGCHFGHKKERWHPKAASYIYQVREGLHIIDLVQTRDGLKKTAGYFRDLAKEGKTVLMVATKKQAKGVVTEAAKRAGLPYLTNRWIGGFITNWDQVKNNIAKINRMRKERTDGSWTKFPKHEIVKLEKELRKSEMVYSGVADLVTLPDALFIVDLKREVASVREAQQYEMPIAAIVDTNVDPTDVDYPIPANDDAVGSIKIIIDYIADAYAEGKAEREKKEEKAENKEQKTLRPDIRKDSGQAENKEQKKDNKDKETETRKQPVKMTK